jgi:hypothetical protein
MAADRPQCPATISGLDERGTIRCTLPPGPHADPQLGAFHQAPSRWPGGLTLWLDTATGAIPAAA